MNGRTLAAFGPLRYCQLVTRHLAQLVSPLLREGAVLLFSIRILPHHVLDALTKDDFWNYARSGRITIYRPWPSSPWSSFFTNPSTLSLNVSLGTLSADLMFPPYATL